LEISDGEMTKTMMVVVVVVMMVMMIMIMMIDDDPFHVNTIRAPIRSFSPSLFSIQERRRGFLA
jgi:hypothetical protein